MGPGQAQRAAVAKLMVMVFAPRSQRVPSGVDWERYGQEGQCWSAQGILRSTWTAGTVKGSSPLGRDCWSLGGGRGRLKRASGGAEQRAHGDHRWRRKTLVVPVVLAVHPMWTDQSRQLIIRLLEPI
jgi:hypothetical protein